MIEDIPERIKHCVELVGGRDILVEKTGIGSRTMSNYLSGESEPKLSKLKIIADVSGVDLGWLAFGNKEESKETLEHSKVDEAFYELIDEAYHCLSTYMNSKKLKLYPDEVYSILILICKLIQKGVNVDNGYLDSLVQLRSAALNSHADP
jgi:transcriptional regulator with XRE-family HTH domain